MKKPFVSIGSVFLFIAGTFLYSNNALAVFVLGPNSCWQNDYQCLNNLQYKYQQEQILKQQSDELKRQQAELDRLKQNAYKPFTVTPLIFPPPPIYVPAPIYIPHYTPSDDNYVDNNPTPTPIPTPIPVPRKPKVLGISTTDRQAPDFIQSKQVPVIVERIFGEVFGTGRKIDPEESKYWKFRARTDKATESKLRSTMKYFLSKGWTYNNL